MPARHHVQSSPDIMCECTRSLDQVSEVQGMAFAWCDCLVSAKPTSSGIAFDVLGDCTTTLDGIAFRIQKVHLLLPSLHRLQHRPSPLEVQFVHEAGCGDRLVLAVLFREGEVCSEAHSVCASLMLEQAPVRLIDLIPLGRRFFVHDASGPARGRHCRELHMISDTEMMIASEQLAELRASMASHQRSAQP